MTALNELARRLTAVEKAVSRGNSMPQLAYSSIEDGNLQEYDADGNLVQIIGLQHDDTHVAAAVNGPNPPAPSAPQCGGATEGIAVKWDGLFADGSATPMNFVRVDIHASLTSGFTPTPATLMTSIHAPGGGDVFIPWYPPVANVYVKLVCVNASGKWSTPSAQGSAESFPVLAGTDGNVPGDVDDPIVAGGIGVLLVRWNAVVNTDPVFYEIYIGTAPGFPIDSTTRLGTTMGTSYSIRELPNGDDLEYGVTYYIQLIAKDGDGYSAWSGEVPAAMHQVTGPDVAADYVYAGTIIVDQLLGGSLTSDVLLSSTIRTALAGQRTEMGPFGLIIYDSAGNSRTVLSPESNIFRGDAELSGATISGTAAIRSVLEIAKSAKIKLLAATTAPTSAPTAINNYYKVQLQTGGWWVNGFHFHSSKFWLTKDLTTGPRISSYPTLGGAAVDNLDLLGTIRPRPWGGLTHIGSSWYTLGWQQNASGIKLWYITKYNDSTGALEAQVTYAPILSGFYNSSSAAAAIGTDGTNVLIAEHDVANTRFRVQTRSPSTLAVSSTLNTGSNSGFTGPVVGVQKGSNDWGGSRYTILSRNGQHHWVFDGTTGAYVPLEAFKTPLPGSMQGFIWDGFRYWSRSIGSDTEQINVYQHSTMFWTDVADGQIWYAGTTWRNTTSSYETPLSPQLPYTQYKRAGVSITAGAAIPANANKVGFYLSKVGGARTNFWRQDSAADGVNTIGIGDTIVFTGTNPPATSNFPDETPGTIESSTGNLIITGAGDITKNGDSILSLVEIDATSWMQTGWGSYGTNASGNYPTPVAFYDPVRKWIHAKLYVKRTGANTASAAAFAGLLIVPGTYLPIGGRHVSGEVASDSGAGTVNMGRAHLVGNTGSIDIVFEAARVFATNEFAFITLEWKVA